MLCETFNDFVSPMKFDSINVFIRFNWHIHDGMKVIQYRLTPLIVLDFFPLIEGTTPSIHAMDKGKLTFHLHPT
jgi:hypothetical protein